MRVERDDIGPELDRDSAVVGDVDTGGLLPDLYIESSVLAAHRPELAHSLEVVVRAIGGENVGVADRAGTQADCNAEGRQCGDEPDDQDHLRRDYDAGESGPHRGHDRPDACRYAEYSGEKVHETLQVPVPNYVRATLDGLEVAGIDG